MSCTLCACFLPTPYSDVPAFLCSGLSSLLCPSANYALIFPNGTVLPPLVAEFMYCQRGDLSTAA
jgi:hypothetical protein